MAELFHLFKFDTGGYLHPIPPRMIKWQEGYNKWRFYFVCGISLTSWVANARARAADL